MRVLLVDAFAQGPLSGNPAAVVLLERNYPDQFLQAVARELNQADTAFISKAISNRYDIRWFTPTTEVELCGHATLAAAKAVREWKLLDPSRTIRFLTVKHGELTCTGDDVISMNFPALRSTGRAIPSDLHMALGFETRVKVSCIGDSAMCLAFRLPDEKAIAAVKPDLARIANYHKVGVAVTAPSSTKGYDFVSRYFAPAAGIPEDPATGSVHCALTPYWAKELKRDELSALQLSTRKGYFRLKNLDNRVELTGNAVITLRGELSV